ncbi:MAG: 2-polyprenyl-3-methyl-6-methoxy-1,4-benzoquinone monooxygenase [Pseudomonadota bacterium]
MTDRQFSPADLLLGEAERVLRTLSGGNSPSNRPRPDRREPEKPGPDTAEMKVADDDTPALEDDERQTSIRLMRVNHAGEVAAQALYQGQALTARLDDVRDEMRQAASEEVDHLAWCEDRLAELGGSPSLLTPFWYGASFAIGAAAGIAGDRWSLGFVAETEAQVVDHLNAHLESMSDNDRASRTILEHMREDEERHGNAARDAGGSPLPAPVKRVMQLVSRVMTRTAYWI